MTAILARTKPATVVIASSRPMSPSAMMAMHARASQRVTTVPASLPRASIVTTETPAPRMHVTPRRDASTTTTTFSARMLTPVRLETDASMVHASLALVIFPATTETPARMTVAKWGQAACSPRMKPSVMTAMPAPVPPCAKAVHAQPPKR